MQDVKLRGVSGSEGKRIAAIYDRTFEKGEEEVIKVGIVGLG
jgi:hypothetical protein